MLLSRYHWMVLLSGQLMGTFLFQILEWPPDDNHDLFLSFGAMLVPTTLALACALLGRIRGRQGATTGLIVGYVIFFAPASVVIFAN
ncbi:hypothetical protein F0A17_03905 [Billgrantia pellis]|uniref:Uncharacterized protein n=1 Tax=Billgrantia pellis TaxID=2606936 RepID=A0A7V7KIG4_9GAMM|nr:hypothetical protein [Halomonas pellis]KAA0013520.1 hypothetical protein F0A17_03905 [Halomonas pellis]